MQCTPTHIPDVKIISPPKFGDHRGFFSETYNRRKLAQASIDLDFVQDNHSFSADQGVVRGLHYQIYPTAQDKLVRVTHGAILDVAVDIRKDSPTFAQHVSIELSSENWRQLLVPVGFAHGFVTLQPQTEVLYKVTALYCPDDERGIRWDDPQLNIDWHLKPDQTPILSDRDANHPRLADQTDLF